MLPGAGNIREAFKFDCRDDRKVPGSLDGKTKFSAKGSNQFGLERKGVAPF
jgi:hypothetical protein